MRRDAKWQKSLYEESYYGVNYFKLIGAVAFIFALLLIFSTIMKAQDPVNDIRTWTKEINLIVGKEIKNENTEKALKAIDKVPGLKQMVHEYNERFGSDSVHALRFVDREPDEKNTSDPILRDYYEVVFVSDSAHQVSIWWNFLVRKDFNEVKYYDLKKSKTTDIDDWKKTWPANEFLKNAVTVK
jgi:hypothetical protein